MKIRFFLYVIFIVILCVNFSNGFGDTLTHVVEFPSPEINAISDGFSSAIIEGCSTGGMGVGYPEVPCKTISLLLPYGKRVSSISIKTSGQEYVGKYKLPVIQKIASIDQPVVVTEPNEEAYSSDQPYPTNLFLNCGTSGYRGYNYQLVCLYPVLYIPATNAVSYYTRFDISLELENSTESGWMTPQESDLLTAKYYSDNKDAADSYFDDANIITQRSLSSADYRYVLITNDDFSYYFQPLVSHKQSRADWITATMVTTSWIYNNYAEDDEQLKIKEFIRDAARNWGTQYVLLGGDGSVVPVRNFRTTWMAGTAEDTPADVYYGALDVTWDADTDGIYGEEVAEWRTYSETLAANDFTYDVNIGRCLVADGDCEGVTNFVNKVISYETSDNLALNEAVFATGRYGSNQTALERMWGYSDSSVEVFSYYYASFNETTLYSGMDNTSWFFHSDFEAQLNNNMVHILNYCGHGGSLDSMAEGQYEDWDNSYYFFVYSASCKAGAYFTEETGLVLVQSLTDPNGIFAFVGESGEADDPTFDYNQKFWRAWLVDDYSSLGEMLSISKHEGVTVLTGNQHNGFMMSYYRLNLLGDPETRLHIFPGIPDRVIQKSGDYNGDGTSDIAYFHPSTKKWLIRGDTTIWFGNEQDVPGCGDYDGDGTTDLAYYRPNNGYWHLRGISTFYFGNSDDVPVPGDYDGDGTCDVAIYRESSARWKVRGVTDFYFGQVGDLPAPDDYAGDGTTEYVVFRNETSPQWRFRNTTLYYYGNSGDIPIPHDADGDGDADIAVYQPKSGRWLIKDYTNFYFGLNSDRCVPGDYDGDGDDDPARYRIMKGKWYIRNITVYYIGESGDSRYGDIPVSR